MKLIKWSVRLLVWAVIGFIGFAAYTNVPTHLTVEDRQSFTEIGLVNPAGPLSFEQEIALIRAVQFAVFKRAHFGKGIPEYMSREPAVLMKIGVGSCYDLSRTFDKAFKYVGFESRHVYLLYQLDAPILRALFRRQSSHAVTEVKTSKGWLYVDSNTPWIALTSQGEPVNADDVFRRIHEFDNQPGSIARWWAIRGLYSRKGQFYGAGLFFPELNWQNFLTWAVLGQ